MSALSHIYSSVSLSPQPCSQIHSEFHLLYLPQKKLSSVSAQSLYIGSLHPSLKQTISLVPVHSLAIFSPVPAPWKKIICTHCLCFLTLTHDPSPLLLAPTSLGGSSSALHNGPLESLAVSWCSCHQVKFTKFSHVPWYALDRVLPQPL